MKRHVMKQRIEKKFLTSTRVAVAAIAFLSSSAGIAAPTQELQIETEYNSMSTGIGCLTETHLSSECLGKLNVLFSNAEKYNPSLIERIKRDEALLSKVKTTAIRNVTNTTEFGAVTDAVTAVKVRIRLGMNDEEKAKFANDLISTDSEQLISASGVRTLSVTASEFGRSGIIALGKSLDYANSKPEEVVIKGYAIDGLGAIESYESVKRLSEELTTVAGQVKDSKEELNESSGRRKIIDSLTTAIAKQDLPEIVLKSLLENAIVFAKVNPTLEGDSGTTLVAKDILNKVASYLMKDRALENKEINKKLLEQTISSLETISAGSVASLQGELKSILNSLMQESALDRTGADADLFKRYRVLVESKLNPDAAAASAALAVIDEVDTALGGVPNLPEETTPAPGDTAPAKLTTGESKAPEFLAAVSSRTINTASQFVFAANRMAAGKDKRSKYSGFNSYVRTAK